MNYQSGGAFRRALEDRLRTISLQGGMPLIRLRKLVAFDRFLARLMKSQPNQWIVKGGLAIQLRFHERARTTKDIDLLVQLQDQVVYPALQSASKVDVGDWFSFQIAQSPRESDGEFGGVRYPVRTFLDGRTFEDFHIDVGIGDPMVEPVNYLSTPPLLEFAGLEPTRVPCFPITQQIAEKFHAYTRPHLSGESSRMKDLVDIMLLAELEDIYGATLHEALQATFQFAGTHRLPGQVPPPPPSWAIAFQKVAKDVGFKDISFPHAHTQIQRFLDPVLKGEALGKKWDPASWSWESIKRE
ncbi:MAG TPA: nucleotidyl transferase AbiEii/AbiGii toxin family protein [Anaerolineaceae bacterium]